MNLKKKLERKEITIGSWLTLGHPSIAEIMAKVGFDWLTIDMEHSAITISEAQKMVQIIDLCNIAALVRVGENDSNLIKRVMDTGAHGVIVPMVNSKEEAERAVKAVKYPPKGNRGVGLARAQGYGVSFDKYSKWNKTDSIVIVQIEHIKAVENLEAILSVDEVDAFIVGPYDLSGSLGRPGEFEHPDVVSALQRVKEISKKCNAVSGFHVVPPDTKLLQNKINEGYKFIAFSLDTLFLSEGCRKSLEVISKRQNNE